jgi:hypothetical protein
MHDECGMRRAFCIHIAFPIAEWRVRSLRPAQRIVGVAVFGTQFVVLRQKELDIVAGRFFCRSGRAGVGSLLAAAVIAYHEKDQRVIQLTDLLQVIHHPAYFVIGVGKKPGIYFHETGVNLLFVSRKRVPGLDTGLPRRQLRTFRCQSAGKLSLEYFFAVFVPTAVKPAFVSIAPLARYVVGRVCGTGREVKEKGLFRIGRLLVGNVRNSLIGQ